MDPREMLQRHQERPKNPIYNQPRQYIKPQPLRFVSGPPTKAHWKPDHLCNECTLCGQGFSLFIRKHHCRRCGEIYCHACCKVTSINKDSALLDQNAQFHPQGLLSRVCDPCFKDSTKREETNVNVKREETNERHWLAITVPLHKDTSQVAETPLMSVPSDWSWSTF